MFFLLQTAHALALSETLFSALAVANHFLSLESL